MILQKAGSRLLITGCRMRGKRDHIEIWTDGACEPNPGPGAYGVHIIWMMGYR